MDKGIKTILCTTMVFALVAGLISGCNAANKENAAALLKGVLTSFRKNGISLRDIDELFATDSK